MFVGSGEIRSRARDNAENIVKSYGNIPANTCCEGDRQRAGEHINQRTDGFRFIREFYSFPGNLSTILRAEGTIYGLLFSVLSSDFTCRKSFSIGARKDADRHGITP